MALTTIEKPMARIALRWLTAAEGGRSSGPPTITVYATTCYFPWRDEKEPDQPYDADRVMSILIQADPPDSDGRATAQIGFLAPHLAGPHLRPGAALLVMEGSRIVAEAVVLDVLPPVGG